ncbi:MAG: hypothetical protein ACXAC7_16720 [Candidatus Hodarchaeales archaeon]|jgi:hypothetical protein
MNKEAEKLVKKYLDDIKNNLPDWIKDNKEKLEDLELEISSHIWDSAYEIAGSDDPDVSSMQKAINKMGSPIEIAKSYKTRGTPKYFISEELWPNFTKIVFSIIAVVFLIIVVVQIVIVEPNNLLQAIINGFTLSLNSITIFIIIVTMIFVYLSAEGYFPEDFDSKGTIRDEKEKFESEYYKPGEFLFNGIAGVILGLLLIILPKDMIGLFRVIVNWIIDLINIGTANYSDFSLSNEIYFWLILSGILTIITAVSNLMKIQTKDPGFHIGMNLLNLFAKVGDLSLIVYLWVNIELLLEVLPQFSENVMLVLLTLAIIGTVIDMIHTVWKSLKLFDLKNNSLAYST